MGRWLAGGNPWLPDGRAGPVGVAYFGEASKTTVLLDHKKAVSSIARCC